MPELATPLQVLLADGTHQLRRAGIPEPRRQVLRLWSELNRADPAQAVLHGDLPVEHASATRFQKAVERRAAGEPLAHVTGWIGFRQLSLRSDHRALIPRPETEGLVELLLQRVSSGVLADLGTGSGCIALSLAHEGSFTQVVAVDQSASALELARSNRRLLGAGEVSLIQGDLGAPLRDEAFDALISNPPYLTEQEYWLLEGSVRDWEPSLALVSGADGLEVTTRLLTEGGRPLRPGGWLAVEVDCSRAQLAAERAGALGWQEVSIHMDLFGRERYLLARRSDTR
jgi:release factor glutamine methyltransferase